MQPRSRYISHFLEKRLYYLMGLNMGVGKWKWSMVHKSSCSGNEFSVSTLLESANRFVAEQILEQHRQDDVHEDDLGNQFKNYLGGYRALSNDFATALDNRACLPSAMSVS